jgi:hypothetical protein
VSGYELVSGYRVWTGARDVERCRDWAMCPMCLAELGIDHHIAWQEGRNPLAGIEAAQPWSPHGHL